MGFIAVVDGPVMTASVTSKSPMERKMSKPSSPGSSTIASSPLPLVDSSCAIKLSLMEAFRFRGLDATGKPSVTDSHIKKSGK